MGYKVNNVRWEEKEKGRERRKTEYVTRGRREGAAAEGVGGGRDERKGWGRGSGQLIMG